MRIDHLNTTLYVTHAAVYNGLCAGLRVIQWYGTTTVLLQWCASDYKLQLFNYFETIIGTRTPIIRV